MASVVAKMGHKPNLRTGLVIGSRATIGNAFVVGTKLKHFFHPSHSGFCQEIDKQPPPRLTSTNRTSLTLRKQSHVDTIEHTSMFV